MSGCDWQKKSFTVSMGSAVIDLCRECGNETEVSYKYNGDILCKECFGKKKNFRVFGGFWTHKDLRYNFTTDMLDGKPVTIRSKAHFKALLKQLGIADASLKECKQETAFRRRLIAEDAAINRRKMADNICSKYRETLKFRKER